MALKSNFMLFAISPRKLAFQSFRANLNKSPAYVSCAWKEKEVQPPRHSSNITSKFVKNFDAFNLNLATTQTCLYRHRRISYNLSRLFPDRRQIRTASMRCLLRHANAFAQRGGAGEWFCQCLLRQRPSQYPTQCQRNLANRVACLAADHTAA